MNDDDFPVCQKCDGTGLVEYRRSMDPACKREEECCPDCDGHGYIAADEAA